MQIEDVHFRPGTISLTQIGWRAAASALSDLAASGGRPLWALLSFHLPPAAPEKVSLALASGAKEILSRYGAMVVGGNVARSEKLAVDAFLVGYRSVPSALSRAGASSGQSILVTGWPGEAALGREIVYDEQRSEVSGADPDLERAIGRFCQPVPRVEVGAWLVKSGLVTAMIDVSDGLVRDLQRLCQASGLGAVINEDRLPVSTGLKAAAGSPEEILSRLLHGGEDYELLFTVPLEEADKLAASITARYGVTTTVIGETIPGAGEVSLNRANGNTTSIQPAGFEHFR